MEEQRKLQPLLAQVKQIIAPLQALAKIRPDTADALGALQAALQKLPDGTGIGEAITGIRSQLASYLEAETEERRSAFGRIEADYIRAVKEGGRQAVEAANGWRIGKLELQHDRDHSAVRCCYNREQVTTWRPVRNREDIEAAEQAALTTLDKAAIQETDLNDLFWEAYQLARGLHRRRTGEPTKRVTMPELNRGLRLALVEEELEGGKPGRRITKIDLPMWAFLYNVDRYASLRPGFPEERRLEFITGSQQEVKSLGMTLHGLEAHQDYRTYCHVASREVSH